MLLFSYGLVKMIKLHGRFFWQDTYLADLGLEGVPLFLADKILENISPFIKNLQSVYF